MKKDGITIIKTPVITYKVNWLRAWKELSIYIFIYFSVTCLLMILFRYIFSGFDYHYTFAHVSPLGMLGFLLLSCCSISLLMISVALILSLYQVSIKNEVLYGRSYWLAKRKIPLNQLKSVERFERQGIYGFMVIGNKKDKIFFPDQIENIESLLQVLAKGHTAAIFHQTK